MLCSSLAKIGSRFPIGPSQEWSGCLCGVWLQQSCIIPVSSVFPVLWLERTGFSWSFSGLHQLVSLGCRLLELQVLDKRGKRKTKTKNTGELTTTLFLGSWGPWLVCLLSIFQTLPAFVLYVIARVLVVINRGIRRNCVYSIFLEVNIYCFFFFSSLFHFFLIGRTACSCHLRFFKEIKQLFLTSLTPTSAPLGLGTLRFRSEFF